MARNPFFGQDDDLYGTQQPPDPQAIRRQALLAQMAPDQPPDQPPGDRRRPMTPGVADVGSRAGEYQPRSPSAGANPYAADIGAAQPRPGVRDPANNAQANQYGARMLDMYDDPYERRNEGAGGFGAGAMKGLKVGAAAAKFAGPYGWAAAPIGAVIGGVAGLFTKNAKTAKTDFASNDARQIIHNAYKEMFGREIPPEEVEQILEGQGMSRGGKWVGEAGLRNVLGSLAQNAAAERIARGGGGVPAAPAGTTAAPPLATSATSPTRGTGGQGVRGGPIDLTLPDGTTRTLPAGRDVTTPGGLPTVPGGGGNGAEGTGGPTDAGAAVSRELGQYAGSLEGFDAGKLQSDHDTPKYQVARVLSRYPPTPEGLQQALAEIQALGLADNVSLIGNDKLQFSGNTDPRFEGITIFDVLRGADVGGQGWQWGAEGGDAQASAASPVGPAGPAGATGQPQPSGPPLAAPLADQSVIEEIMAEIQRLTRGDAPRAALLAKLGG